MSRSIAAHLDIAIPLHTPPASPSFITTRHHAQLIWTAYRTCTNILPGLDDQVAKAYISFLRANRQARVSERELERARIVLGLYVVPIMEAEAHCAELERAMEALEGAARREPDTVEARATMEIDMGLMRGDLVLTREIIQVARIQLGKAKARLGLSEGV